MKYENIIYEKIDEIAKITLNRPNKLNALNDAILRDFDEALQNASEEKDVKVLIIKGAGTSFCAGYDMSGIGTETVNFDWRTRPYMADVYEAEKRRQARIEKIWKFPKPTIAQVQGYCLEAGCHIAMACDTTIAAENARFGDPSVRMGRVSAMPLWHYTIGIKKAKELLFTGKIIDGKEAEQIGLINKAVPFENLEHEVEIRARATLLTPTDGLANSRFGSQIAWDARGVAAGWSFAGEMHVFSILQQAGTRPGEFDFFDVRDKKGLKTAFKEMNAPYKELGF